MLVPFYISSIGGTATMWINKVLNAHSKIISYHGTRSLPPFDSGTNDISAEIFAKGLTLSMQNTGHSKAFGAIHGYYGLVMQEAITNEGGVFCAVTRSPIKRINSLFHHDYKNLLNSEKLSCANDVSIYVDLVDKGFDSISIDKQTQHIIISEAARIFEGFCSSTFGQDVVLLDGLCTDAHFKMELLVKDKEYFVHFFETITDKKITIKQAYLDEVFQTSTVNPHANSTEVEQQIFDSWPDIFKLIYRNVMVANGAKKLMDKYQQLDYELVNNLEDEFIMENNKFKLVN